jgi:hypothetical protein
MRLTSEISQKEGIRVGRFVKETYGCNQLLKDLSNKVINVTTLQAKQEIKRCDVTYIVVVCSLGLASQEVDVFDKSTNEIA